MEPKTTDSSLILPLIESTNLPQVKSHSSISRCAEAPFVIYADFDSINEKVHGCQPNYDKSYTESYQKHEDCGYGYKLVCRYDDKYSKPFHIYRGENAVHKFVKKNVGRS